MSDRIRFMIVLVSVGFCAALGVAGVYTLTRPRITERERQEAEQARRDVAPPGSVKFEVLSDRDGVYEAFDAAGTRLGYVATGQARGYSGEVQVMVGFDVDLKVMQVVVTAQTETPGLGAELSKTVTSRTVWGMIGLDGSEETKSSWLDQFRGKSGDGLTLGPGKIDARTGATITSRAVTVAVHQAWENVHKQVKITRERP